MAAVLANKSMGIGSRAAAAKPARGSVMVTRAASGFKGMSGLECESSGVGIRGLGAVECVCADWRSL